MVSRKAHCRGSTLIPTTYSVPQEHVFLQDDAAADTWQSYATSDLSSVRHLAVLLLLVLMGLDKLPTSSGDGQPVRQDI